MPTDDAPVRHRAVPGEEAAGVHEWAQVEGVWSKTYNDSMTMIYYRHSSRAFAVTFNNLNLTGGIRHD